MLGGIGRDAPMCTCIWCMGEEVCVSSGGGVAELTLVVLSDLAILRLSHFLAVLVRQKSRSTSRSYRGQHRAQDGKISFSNYFSTSFLYM